MFKYLNSICLLFCICNSVVAQSDFNTARYKAPTEDKNMSIEDVKEPQANSEKLKKDNWLKRLFKRKEKPDFKSEIDSLKSLIIQKDLEYKNSLDKIVYSVEEINKNKKRNEVKKDIKSQEKDDIVKVCMPLKIMFVKSPFGIRKHPIDNEIKMHNGIDLRADYERVYAIMNGKVVETGFDKNGGGKFMKIAHSNKISTLYLHLSEVYYKRGDEVKAGFIIAQSGNTGKSTSPHLHFAVKENGKFINPMKFLNQLIEINNIINLNRYARK